MDVRIKDSLMPIGFVAKVFFEKDAQWLRRHDNAGHLVDAEGSIGTRSENRKLGSGDRLFSILDVRRIVYALSAREQISGPMADRVLNRFKVLNYPVDGE